ncbi:MAG: DUF6048 family protein [Flavobacterium sp.]|jgi:hypothetical protein|uniref:DUF6048 family protein n=1 Tax=Flavobacterium sp. TaxID=239 RepID=UPI0029773FF9|nr:DUF6048 family protein [Flavobacterium sp.]TAF08554.1 MAG: hypothetical protein EAZ75_10375 [Flavobacteriia bacterium]WRH73149.1 MAG: DUF6048 family protein [Flavobacterium sp.]
MLKFIFSLSLVCVSLLGNAQTKDTTKVLYPERYGLRLGIDLHKIARTFYEKDYRGLEVVGDYRLTKKFYVAGEIGNEDKTIDDDRLNFTTKGTYFKVGFDYNSFENWLDMENMIYVGMRYGVSSFSHTLNTYKIYDPTNYYGETIITSGAKFDNLNASWVEVIGGIKAELFNNLYLGFSVRLNYLVSNKKPADFDNLFIPGYNRTYDGKFGAGFNYTLSYFIPIYKKKKEIEPTKK